MFLLLPLILLTLQQQMKAQDVVLRVDGSTGLYLNQGAGTSINISSPGPTGGVYIGNSGSITNNGTIQLNGNWINNGNGLHTSSVGKIIFAGTSLQQAGGTAVTDFYDLELNNNAGLSLLQSQTVHHQMTLTSGGLSINNKLLTLNGLVTGSGTLNGGAASDLTIGGAAGILQFGTGANTLHNFLLTNGASATLGNSLFITGGSAPGSLTLNSGAVLQTAGLLTLRSDAAGTARVAPSAGTVNGTVTVERYLPSRRAWALVSAPIRNSGYIWNNWQNNGMVTGTTGVDIWGPTGNPAVNGLSVGPNYNMRTYANTSNSWSPVTDTKNTLLSNASTGTTACNKAFLLFATGTFGSNHISPATGSVPVTLSASGNLQLGDQSFPIAPANYTLVGNPYASGVSFASLFAHNSTVIQNRFWLLDASVPAYGAYKVVYFDGTSYRMVPNVFSQAPGAPGAGDYQYLQSGQAIFVEPAGGGGTLTFSETDKAVASTNPDIFFANGVAGQELALNIYKDSSLLDGTLMLFGPDFSAGIVNEEDVRKQYNDGLNITINRNNDGYVIESRPPVTTKDTSFLWFSGAQANQAYKIALLARNFDPQVTAWLEDSYTNTRTPVSLLGNITEISFSTNSDPASRGLNRFRIIYQKSGGTLPIHFTFINANQQGAAVNVQWGVANEENIDHYELEYSDDGNSYHSLASLQSKNNNGGFASYTFLHTNPVTGQNYYRVKLLEKGSNVTYSQVASVKIAGTLPEETVWIYPNPVTDGFAIIELRSAQTGRYQAVLVGLDGQLISKDLLDHNGSVSKHRYSLPSQLPAGYYQLLITAPDGKHYHLPLVISRR